MRRSIALLMVLLSIGHYPAAARPTATDTQADPLVASQWHLDLIGAPDAWGYSTGRGVTIAIIDTGIAARHPDLKKNVVGPGYTIQESGGVTKGAQDTTGHGTHVAGIAAAVGGNGIGGSGVAPKARILPIRRGDGDAALALAVDLAVRKGADVINLSSGNLPQEFPNGSEFPLATDAFERAWKQGLVIVSITQNDFVLPWCTYPGRHPRVLCVGATNRSDVKALYSNYDARMASNHLVAPGGEVVVTHGLTDVQCGEQILSTYVHLQGSLPYVTPARSECSPGDGYDELSGSSMAAPIVSGVAALLLAQGLHNEDVVEIILTTSVDLGAPGRDPIYGHGRVSAIDAVMSAPGGTIRGWRQPWPP